MSDQEQESQTEALFDRADLDETGELKHLVMEVIEIVKRMGSLGVPLNEIASVCTMAWYLGQNPEVEKMVGGMLDLNNFDKNKIN